MTGRKWESEVDDASRYCQITRRMHQILPFLQPVLVISLASFSLVNFPGMKVCVGREGRRSSASHLPSHCGNPDIVCTRPWRWWTVGENFAFRYIYWRPLFFLTRHLERKTSPSPAALMYVQSMRQFYASVRVTPSAQMGPFKSEDIFFPWWWKRKRGKQWVQNESWSTRTKKKKHAICTDQLSQRERACFNAFEGKPWCAMSLSSSRVVLNYCSYLSKSGQNEKWIQ